MKPITMPDSRSICVKLSGNCSAPIPSMGISFIATRIGTGEKVTAMASTVDGKVCATFMQNAEMPKGRWKVEIAGWPKCVLCFPMEVLEKCEIISIVANDDCVLCAPSAQTPNSPPVPETPPAPAPYYDPNLAFPRTV